MGFAVWIDDELAWAQGTHEYRPMGTAVIGRRGQFHRRDFAQLRGRPAHLENSFAGFFGSLEEVNARLRSEARGGVRSETRRRLRSEPRETPWKLRWTPGHLR